MEWEGRPAHLSSLRFDRAEWRADAACRGLDTAMFYPGPGADMAQARAVCASCDVSLECLRYALDHDEKFGIFGGRSERQRKQMRKGRGLSPRRCRLLSCQCSFVPRSSGQFYCSPDHVSRARTIAKRETG